MATLIRETKETLTEKQVDDLFDLEPLFQEAKEKLGYSDGIAKVKNNKQTGASNHNLRAFRQWLHDKDIRPFTARSVERYKKSKADSAMGFYVAAPFLTIAVLSLLSLVVAGIAWGGFDAAWGKTLAGVALLCFIGSFVVLMGLCSIYSERRVFWRLRPLREAEGVPPYALQTALDIKSKFKECEFLVDEFHYWRAPDPFLVARYGGQDFYLEVWNEPGYRQQREV